MPRGRGSAGPGAALGTMLTRRGSFFGILCLAMASLLVNSTPVRGSSFFVRSTVEHTANPCSAEISPCSPGFTCFPKGSSSIECFHPTQKQDDLCQRLCPARLRATCVQDFSAYTHTCRCGLGKVGLDGSQCLDCPADTYKDAVGPMGCTACPTATPSTYSLTGRTSVSECSTLKTVTGPNVIPALVAGRTMSTWEHTGKRTTNDITFSLSSAASITLTPKCAGVAFLPPFLVFRNVNDASQLTRSFIVRGLVVGAHTVTYEISGDHASHFSAVAPSTVTVLPTPDGLWFSPVSLAQEHELSLSSTPWTMVNRKKTKTFLSWASGCNAACATNNIASGDCASNVCGTSWQRMAFTFEDDRDVIVWFDKDSVSAGCLNVIAGTASGDQTSSIVMNKYVSGVTTTGTVSTVYCNKDKGLTEQLDQSDLWLNMWFQADVQGNNYISEQTAGTIGMKCLAGICRDATIVTYVSDTLDDPTTTLPPLVRIGKWTDESVSTAHLTQHASTKQPYLVPHAVPSGHPAVRFDGVDDWMQLLSTGALQGYHARTITLVFRRHDTQSADFNSVFGMWTGTNDDRQSTDGLSLEYSSIANEGLLKLSSNHLTAAIYAPPSLSFTDKTFHVVAIRFDGTSATTWIDGVQQSTTTATAGSFGPRFSLAAGHNIVQQDPSQPSPLDVLEIQMHKSALSDVEMLALTQHFVTFYGLSGPHLPIGGSIPDGLWFTSEVGLPSPGTHVDEWPDQTVSGAHLRRQGTSTGRPAVIANASPKGHSAVRFDGVDDWLELESTLALGSYHERTITIVLRRHGKVLGTYAGLFAMYPTGQIDYNSADGFSCTFRPSSPGSEYCAGTASVTEWYFAGTSSTDILRDTEFHVLSIRFDGTDVTGWLNGVQKHSTTLSTGNFGPSLVIGARHSTTDTSPNNPTAIDVLEFQMHKSALTNAQITALADRLALIYGIPSTSSHLPASYPAPDALWFVPESLPSEGGPVDVWTDSSASLANLLQSTASRQPLVLPNAAPSGHSALRFDGVDDWLELTSSDALGAYHERTVTVVFRRHNALLTAVNGIWAFWSGTSDDHNHASGMAMHYDGTKVGSALCIVSSASVAYFSGSASDMFDDTEFHVATMQLDGTNARAWLDGIYQGATPLTTGNFGPRFVIGARHGDSGSSVPDRPSPIDVLEIQMHKSSLSSGQIRDLAAHLRYNVYGYTRPMRPMGPEHVPRGGVTPDAAWFTPASLPTGTMLTVQFWADQTGNRAHLQQTSASKRPTVVIGASPKGHSAVRFDGVDDWLELESTLALGSYHERTITIVFRRYGNLGAAFQGIFAMWSANSVADNSADGLSFRFINNDVGTAHIHHQGTNVYTSGSVGGTYKDQQFHVVSIRFSGSDATIWLNGVQQDSGSITSGNFGPKFVIGARHGIAQADPNKPAPIDVLEIQMHKSSLSNGQIVELSEHLGQIYGLPPTDQASLVPADGIIPDALWFTNQGLPKEAGPISLWRDFSPNSAHLQQPSTNSQPLVLQNASPKGHSAVRFDGVDDWLELESTLALGSYHERTITIVFRLHASHKVDSEGIISLFTGTNDDWSAVNSISFTFVNQASNTGIYSGAHITGNAIYTAGSGGSSYVDSVFHTVSMRFDGTAATIWLNGIQQQSAPCTGGSFGPRFVLAARGHTSITMWSPIDVLEIQMHKSALSNVQMLALALRLKSHYGI